MSKRRRRRRLGQAAVLALLVGAGLPLAAQQDAGWAALTAGSIVLFRHAQAPGGGDPPGMALGECRTQRNLDDTGRAQARRIGEQFRQRRITVGAVLHSQWCRTRETAELAFAAQPASAPAAAPPPRADPRFNSFFGAPERASTQTAAALAALRQWRGPGVLVVVTHQVNITALTGVVPSSGEGVVVRPRAEGVEVLARLRVD